MTRLHKLLSAAVVLAALAPATMQAFFGPPAPDGLRNILFIVSVALAAVSFCTETLWFWYVQPQASLARSCSMSLFGNLAVPGVVGILSWLINLWTLTLPVFIAIIYLYLVSTVTQLVVIPAFFKYSYRQLALPVLLGHALAYLVSALLLILL